MCRIALKVSWLSNFISSWKCLNKLRAAYQSKTISYFNQHLQTHLQVTPTIHPYLHPLIPTLTPKHTFTHTTLHPANFNAFLCEPQIRFVKPVTVKSGETERMHFYLEFHPTSQFFQISLSTFPHLSNPPIPNLISIFG